MRDPLCRKSKDENERAMEAPTINLSIIIPAYNTMPHCKTLIDSIVNQDRGTYRMEVIAVDDGSTDGTGAYLDEAANRCDFLHVYHIENSGTPSIPRNRGIEYARGEYVFFADADDRFLDGALKRMLQRAYAANADVAVVKLDGSDWGLTWGDLFEKSRDDCTVENSPILNSLGPWKLFRRSLICDNDIRFPTECAYEDLPFTLEAYLNAERISIFADADYYKYVKRKEGSLSHLDKDSDSNFAKPEWKVSGIVNYLSTASKYATPEARPLIYLRAFRYAARHYLSLAHEGGEQYTRLKEALAPYYCEEVRSNLSFTGIIDADAFLLNEKSTYCAIRAQMETAIFSIIRNKDGHDYLVRATDGTELLRGKMPRFAGRGLSSPRFRRAHLAEIHGGDSLHLAGHFLALAGEPSSFSSGALTGKTPDGTEIGSWPVSISALEDWLPYENVRCVSGDFACDIASAALGQMDFDTIEEDVRLDLYLTLTTEGQSYDLRLGKYRIGAIGDAFNQAVMLTPAYLFKPLITARGNFSFKVIPLPERTAQAAFERAIGPKFESAIETIAWKDDAIELSGIIEELLVLCNLMKCDLVVLDEQGDRADDACRCLHFTLTENGRWQLRIDPVDVLQHADDGNRHLYHLSWRILFDDVCILRPFGARRPAGSMAIYRSRAVEHRGSLFIPMEGAGKSLGFQTTPLGHFLADELRPRIASLSWRESNLHLELAMRSPVSRIEDFSARIVLTDEEERIIPCATSKHIMENPREWAYSAEVPLADLAEAETGEPTHWKLALATSAYGVDAVQALGARRAPGSRAVFESKAFATLERCVIPTLLADKTLAFAVSSIDAALRSPATPRIEDLAWKDGTLVLRGTAKHPLVHAGVFTCEVVLREQSTGEALTCSGSSTYDEKTGKLHWTTSIRPDLVLKGARRGTWCLAMRKSTNGKSQIEPFGKKRPVGTLAVFMDYSYTRLNTVIAPVDLGETIGFTLRRRFW